MTLTLRNLTMTWPPAGGPCGPLLKAVSVQFDTGRMTLITGPTGAGKSTLLHLLAGLLRPTSGEVCDQDRPVSRWPTSHRDRWRSGVGICFQNLHLTTGLTVLENVLQPMIPRDMEWAAMVSQARQTVARVDLAEFMQTPVQLLSGGQQQRVAVARALAHTPRILLLDEPTAFQDDEHTQMMVDLFDQYASGGACIVVSSHDGRLRQSHRFHIRYHLNGGTLEAMT